MILAKFKAQFTFSYDSIVTKCWKALIRLVLIVLYFLRNESAQRFPNFPRYHLQFCEIICGSICAIRIAC